MVIGAVQTVIGAHVRDGKVGSKQKSGGVHSSPGRPVQPVGHRQQASQGIHQRANTFVDACTMQCERPLRLGRKFT